MTEPPDLRIDVAAPLPAEVTGGKPLHIEAWVFLSPNPHAKAGFYNAS